jgi:hypothetical protein
MGPMGRGVLGAVVDESVTMLDDAASLVGMLFSTPIIVRQKRETFLPFTLKPAQCILRSKRDALRHATPAAIKDSWQLDTGYGPQ